MIKLIENLQGTFMSLLLILILLLVGYAYYTMYKRVKNEKFKFVLKYIIPALVILEIIIELGTRH